MIILIASGQSNGILVIVTGRWRMLSVLDALFEPTLVVLLRSLELP
jgi:hypothetical protein